MDINFKISKQKLFCSNIRYVVSGQKNSVRANFNFDSEWDDVNKIVTFINAASNVKVFVVLGTDDSCLIPWEVLENEGHLYVYLEGTKLVNDLQIVIATKMQSPIDILLSDKVDDPSEEFKATPSLYEQLVNRIDAISTGTINEEKLKELVVKYMNEHTTNYDDAILNIAANGKELPIINKTVDIPIPTKTSDLDNDNDYITKAETNRIIEPIQTNISAITSISQEALNKVDDLISFGISNEASDINYSNSSYGDFTNVDAALDMIFDKLYYTDPKIMSFNMNPANTQYEKGSVISGISFSWSTNKNMLTQTLTGCNISASDTQASYSSNISSNTTFTLTVGDGTNTTSSSKTISFLSKKYYGASIIPSIYDDMFLLGLTGVLASNKNGTVNITANENEYIFFAIPSSFGIANFKIGGFDTELDLVRTFNHTNASGYMCEYNIYKTTQPNLGTVVLVVA